MKAATLRNWQGVHRWTSLICTVNLLLLCITGFILMFHHEIDELLGQEVEIVRPDGAEMRPMQELLDIGQRMHPDLVPRVVTSSHEDPGMVFLSFGKPGVPDSPDDIWLVVNGFTGEMEPLRTPTQSFTRFITQIHIDLFAGLPGQLFVGVMGLLFAVSTISGLVLYGPFMKRLAFGLVRFGRHTRIVHTDLHNLFGVATLVWALVVGLTGTILSFSPLILGVWQQTELADMAARHAAPPPSRLVSVDTAIASAQGAFPGEEFAFLLFPGTRYATERHYTVAVRGHTELSQRMVSFAMVDGETGALAEAAGSPWYIKALFLSGPFHFGDYGGLPLRILWALFTLVTGAVTVTGFVVWLKRPRKRPEDRGAEQQGVKVRA